MADRTLGRDTSRLREEIRAAIEATGCVAVGFAKAGRLPDDVALQYSRWIDRNGNAGMEYLKRHDTLRRNLSNVLEGTRTIICVAYSFVPDRTRIETLPVIAGYALGDDYHDVLRGLLQPVAEDISTRYGCRCRICIDSAPVAERYWAVKSGIGIIGRNGTLITRKGGSMVFLAELLTDLELEPDKSAIGSCLECGRCIRECPGQALRDDGTLDSSRCISYLTIEHRGPWEGEGLQVMQTQGQRYLYGCDTCLSVCPHNAGLQPTRVRQLLPREEMLTLDADLIMAMNDDGLRTLTRRSPIKRCKPEGLRRNAVNCQSSSPHHS